VSDDWFEDDQAPAPVADDWFASGDIDTSRNVRYDPMYEYAFMWGSANASWDNTTAGSRQRDILDYRVLACPDGSLSLAGATFACLVMWHTLTTDQVAAMTGQNTLTAEKTLRGLASIGAIRRGVITQASDVISRSPLPEVWSLRAWAERSRCLEALRFDTRLAIDAATEMSRGMTPNAAFHNVLVAEVAMSISEHSTGVASVFGPHLGSYRAITSQSAASGFADGAVVLKNGATIAIEMQTAKRSDPAHMERHLRTLAAASYEKTGLSVVYVAASRDGREGGSATQLRRSLASLIEGRIETLSNGDVVKRAPAYLGPYAKEAQERLYVVDWADWFPSAHVASDQLRTMTARRLSDGAEIQLSDLAAVVLPDRLKAPLDAAPLLAASMSPGRSRPVIYTTRSRLRPPLEAMTGVRKDADSRFLSADEMCGTVGKKTFAWS
jgi:hypothetical protein